MLQSGGQLQGSGLQLLFYSKQNVQSLGCKQVHCESSTLAGIPYSLVQQL